MGRSAIACALTALTVAACGERAALPRSCAQARTGDVLRALRTAPHGVALADGTSLSTCVARALGDADLQTVGATLTATADRLARELPDSDAAAYRLGFLIGATERGAAHTAGVQAELAARIEQAAGFDGGPRQRRRALLAGRAAGRRRG